MANRKIFNSEERQTIADILRSDAQESASPDNLIAVIEAAIDQIQFWVSHTCKQVSKIRHAKVPSESFKEKYKRLGKPIDRILAVVDDEYYKDTVGDFPPGLRSSLRTLKKMVEQDKRGRGRTVAPPDNLKHILVCELASIFHRVTQESPTTLAKESYDPTDEMPPALLDTTFERFVSACTDPYGLELTSYQVKRGKDLFIEEIESSDRLSHLPIR